MYYVDLQIYLDYRCKNMVIEGLRVRDKPKSHDWKFVLKDLHFLEIHADLAHKKPQ